MEETLERELLRASRKQLSVGLIMLDVDDFKRINDTYGHAAGDAVLRELGNILLEHVRGEDVPSRYGGDEFIIVLPDASREVTRERADRLCEHARNVNIQLDEQALPRITLSAGVAAYPDDGSTAEAVLKAADDALYRAKREGRGRVVGAN